ncbi:hypothetical protein GINT2_001470 [Glugoides intestinalis]
MKDENLIKVLEYGKIETRKAFNAICNTLGLELYFEAENELFTLSSDFFVLDICKEECSLIFVDESLNTKLSYIELYFRNFLSQKQLFYYLLRYLLECGRAVSSQENQQGTLKKHKAFCSCILTKKYCETFDLAKVEPNFNIFTHARVEFPIYHYFTKSEFLIPPKNLAIIFPMEKFDKECIQIIDSDVQPIYECDNIKVEKNSVFIDGVRSHVASFAFSQGCTLKESIEFSEILDLL